MGKYFNKEKDSNTNSQATEFVVRDGVLMKYNGNTFRGYKFNEV